MARGIETKEEKKLRKEKIKSERKERRQEKKGNTKAFKSEKGRQATLVPNHKMQKLTVPL